MIRPALELTSATASAGWHDAGLRRPPRITLNAPMNIFGLAGRGFPRRAFGLVTVRSARFLRS
jgi:hypothetical protein